MKKTKPFLRWGKATALVGIMSLVAAGCATTDVGGASVSEVVATDDPIVLSILIPAEQYPDAVQALVDRFTAKNPNITASFSVFPGGTEGQNIVKTKLATGEMEDIFIYNPGAQLGALEPDQTLVDLSGEAWVATLDAGFVQTVTTSEGTYGAPFGSSMGGGVLYNVNVYEELGLEVPQDWAQFLENNQIILDAGAVVPIVQSYGADWTAQLWVLADYGNINAVNPNYPAQYTDNEVKNAEQPALQAWLNFEEVRDRGFFNRDYASKTFEQAMLDLATGVAAHYPMLTGGLATVNQSNPELLDNIGFFPMPAQRAVDTTLTMWPANAWYIPKTTEGATLVAAKAFLAFVNSEEGCAVQNEFLTVQGPFHTDCVPLSAPRAVRDMQPYFDAGKTSAALEFLTPVKGPNLPGISVEVGSGISGGQAGAASYDVDVVNQAKQLGLPGW